MKVVCENWLPVARHPQYEVSDLGRVRSLDHFTMQKDKGGVVRPFRRAGKLLKPGIASNGYPTVCLGRGNTRTVHSLVAEAFVGPCPVGQEVRHKDGDRKNPVADNLHYGTRSENIYDAIAHGTWNGNKRAATRYGYAP